MRPGWKEPHVQTNDPSASAGAPRPAAADPAIAPPIVPPTAPPATPAWSAPRTESVAWTPTPATAAAPAAMRPPSGEHGVGARFVVGAVIAATVLASGGTYLAVSAANGGRDGAGASPILTTAVTPASPAPSAVAPGGVAPVPATPGPPAIGSTSVVDIVKAVSPAVVTIVAEGVTETDPTTGMTGQGTATGSGVIFDASGLILTNHHVVAGDPSSLTVHLKDGRSFDGTIYGIDTLTDLAIVKVEASGLPTAPIGDSSTIQVGQTAIAIGSPLGQFTDSVTSGIISAVGRDIPVEGTTLTNLIQTDTAINPGNSGGPLLDPTGKVIGINTAVAGDSQGIGFAIPIDIARPLLTQASAGQPLARAWLGIMFVTIDPTTKAENGLTVDNGAWIPDAGASSAAGAGIAESAIIAGSPAAKAGLQTGDVITAVDGTVLDAAHPLDLVTSQLAPGQTVQLTVLRGGGTVTLSLTLGTRPQTM
jgi:serine protease Do